MKEPGDKNEKLLKRRKKIVEIIYHEKKHKEQREKMQQADGGYTDDISMDKELETLKPSWQERTDDMRASLRKRKAKARAMWRGR